MNAKAVNRGSDVIVPEGYEGSETQAFARHVAAHAKAEIATTKRPVLTQRDFDEIQALCREGDDVPAKLVRRLLDDHAQWVKRAFAAVEQSKRAAEGDKP